MDGDIKVKNRHFSLPHSESMPSLKAILPKFQMNLVVNYDDGSYRWWRPRDLGFIRL